MKKQSLNALAASYRADLLYYIERAKLGKCPPHWQAYCFGELAAAKGTDAYPEDGDALLDELHRLVDTVPQITNREESAAEIAAYRGQMLFYFDRDYYTLAELVRLPDRKKYGACVYIDADGSRQDRPATSAPRRGCCACARAWASTPTTARPRSGRSWRTPPR